MPSPSSIDGEEENVLLELAEDTESINLSSKKPHALEDEVEDGLSFRLSKPRRRTSIWQRILMTLRKRRPSVSHEHLEHEPGCSHQAGRSRNWKYPK
ncbi:hypothetical protein LTS18_013985, partial [Coniosporium uncinatum]